MANPARFDSGALGYALAIYFLTLTPVLVAIVQKSIRIDTLRAIELALVGIGAAAAAVRWRDCKEAFGAPTLTWRGATYASAATGAVFLVALILTSAFPTVDANEVARYRGAGPGMGMALLDISLLPALGEEIVFRVAILSALLRVFREQTACVVSALLFATLHVSPVSFVHLSLLGWILARVRIETKSVYPCMAIHAAYNAIIVLTLW